MNKKILSLCIASTMLLSALPTTVFAASIGSIDTDKSVGSDSIQNQQTQYADFRESNAETEVYLTVDDSELLVSVPSTVILDGTPDDNGQYIGKYSVGVKGDIAGNKAVIVEPESDTVTLHQNGKVNTDATIAQDQIEFDTDDFRNETVTNGNITATGLTAGSWNSEFNFNIAMTKDGIPAGYTTLYEYDLSATENDNVKAYYAVPIRNTSPIDSSTFSLFSTRASNNENVVEYNGVRYKLSDEDTLVINGEGKTNEVFSNLNDFAGLYDVTYNYFKDNYDVAIPNEYNKVGSDQAGKYYLAFKENTTEVRVYTIGNDETFRYQFDINLYDKNHKVVFLAYDSKRNTEIEAEVQAYVDSIKNNYTINVPNKVIVKEGITELANKSFYNCSNIEKVILPSTLTKIGYNAFYNCNKLTTLGGMNSGCNVEWNIKNDICRGIADKFQLTSVIIPNGVTSIDSQAFYKCSRLTSVTIPDSVTSIGSSAFYGCVNLTNVTIPDGVTSIGYSAFEGCSSLTNVTIPNGVTSIDNQMFYNCSRLASVTILNGVTSIGRAAFGSCSNLTSVIIPNGVTIIADSAFSSCSRLTSVTIPDSVTSIGSSAFGSCSGLTSVTIPNGVTNIGRAAFSGVKNIIYNGSATGSPWGANYLNGFVDGDFIYSDSSKEALVQYGGNNSFVIIPDGVTSIDKKAFRNCATLTSVSMPDSLTSIGNIAFSNCSSLTSVTIPNSVTSIGSSAFSGCSSLTSVTIPNSVTSIGSGAFNNLASGSTIYCQSQAVADLVAGKYTTSKTTVVVDASKFE